MRFSQSWMIEKYYFLFLCFSKRLEFDVCGKINALLIFSLKLIKYARDL